MIVQPEPVPYRKHAFSFLKKCLSVFLMVFFLLPISGCASSSVSLDDTRTFFTAFNHLLEADTLQAFGKADLLVYNGSFEFYLDQSKDIELAFLLETKGGPVDFYIRNGNTYLDYLGEKSSSKAENIGLTRGSKLSFYNPFLDYTDEERASFFNSSEKNGDEYTFEINSDKLAALLDDYGAVSIEKAILKAGIQNEKITSLDLSVKGSMSYADASAPMQINIQINIEKMNEPVSIPFPTDLADYPDASGSSSSKN